jgi:phage terminase large subunit
MSQTQADESDIDFPEALQFLFEPARYKVAYGGRGGAKSWGAARALLIQGLQQPLRILCARELQKSISDSVHKLIADQISAMGFDHLYTVQETKITGTNGTEFRFAGLRHNVNSIKSFEGVDRVWCEEAQTVSKASWDVLIPTIRKDGSEIWITFNPELDTDETWKRFVVNPPTGAVVRKVGWQDNPWFNDVLRQEMLDLEARDPDSALVVWGGHTRQTLDGAVYAAEIRDATKAGRMTRVPYDPTKPVHTFWDLGWADNTSIWFGQVVGFETRAIDFYQNSQKPLDHYLKVLQERGYVLGTCWLPHDARAKQLGSGRSIEELMRAAGRTVQIVPQLSIADGINAARTVFPNVWFDADRCADGLQCLRRYRYDVDAATGQFSRVPLHDDASHGADAFRYMAVALKEKRPVAPKIRLIPSQRPSMGGGGWMRA